MPENVCEKVVGRRQKDSTGKSAASSSGGEGQRQGGDLDVAIEEFMAAMYPGLPDSS